MKKRTILLIALMVISVGLLSGCTEQKGVTGDTKDFDGLGVYSERNAMEIKGVEDKTSALFYISGNNWHFTVQLSSDSYYPYFYVYAYDENDKSVGHFESEKSFIFSEQIDIDDGSGWYYLDIHEANLEYWSIWVYDNCELPHFNKKYHGDFDKVEILDYEITSSVISKDDKYGILMETTVTGTAKNIAGKTLSHVCIRATFFDENGDYFDPSRIVGNYIYYKYYVSPGQTWNFKLNCSTISEISGTPKSVTFEIYT